MTAIYASLVRLQQRGWIDSEWGISESITRGAKQLAADVQRWGRLSDVMSRVLAQNVEDAR